MKINGNPDGGGGGVIASLSVSANGTYTAGGGVDGYSPVEVSVPERIPVTESLNVSANGTYNPGQGVDGFSQVEVSVPVPVPVMESLTVSVNNTYYPGSGVTGFSQVIVDVPQSTSGITEKEYTEHAFHYVNLSNSASFVAKEKFYDEKELRTVTLGNCGYIGSSAFYECTNLSEVSLPACSVISSNAFLNTGIVSLYLPSCKSLGVQAFRYCLSLRQVDMPELISVEMSAFYQCMSLTSISFSKLGYIGSYMFYSCYSLKDLNIPNVSRINNQGFAICRSLSEVNLPRVEYVSDYAFWACSNLSEVNLPECTYVGQYAFAECSSLTSFDLHNCTYLGTHAFERCISLSSYSLPLCTYIGKNAFNVLSNNNTSIYLPMCAYLASLTVQWPSLTTVNMPIVRSWYTQGWWSLPITDFSFGNMTYLVPPYAENMGSILTRGGHIYIPTNMWDKWLSANGWSSLSAAFSSFSYNNDMLAFVSGYDSEDQYYGNAYGETWALFSDWDTALTPHVGKSDVIMMDFEHCKYVEEVDDFHALEYMYFPECKLFKGAKGLYGIRSVYLSNCELIQTSTLFGDCGGEPINIQLGTGLSTVCKLSPVWGVYNTIVVGSNANFYVPDELVSDYKSALYWSSISSQIFPMSEYPYDDPGGDEGGDEGGEEPVEE